MSSLINNKISAIYSVGLFEILCNLPKTKATFSINSITSKDKNLLPFMMDLSSITAHVNIKKPNLPSFGGGTGGGGSFTPPTVSIPSLSIPKVTIPSCDSTRILNEMLIDNFPILMRKIKEGILSGIKSSLTDVDFTLPTPTPSFTIPVSNIDFNGLLKTNPTTDTGSMFYGKNSNTDFNWFLYNVIQNGGTSNWKNIVTTTYNQATEEINFQLNNSYGGKNFSVFLLDFINSIELLSLENFMTNMTNSLTGALSSVSNTSLDSLIAQEKINKLQDKINSTDPCKEDYQAPNNYTFSNDDLIEIERSAIQKNRGVVEMDLGCGIVESSVTTEVVKGIFDTIRSNNANNTQSVVNLSTQVLNDSLTKNVLPVDKLVSVCFLNKKMVLEIPKILTNITLEPKIVFLYQMSLNITSSKTLKVKNSYDYSNQSKKFFEFMTRHSLSVILEFIFKTIKEDILILVSACAKKILQEQVKLKIKAISSIISGVVDNNFVTPPKTQTSEFS